MPRGRGKGGKNRKKGKAQQMKEKRELEFKTDGQEYAQVLRLLGSARAELQCFDGRKRLGTIRGAMKNRIWINCGDIVLVGLREFDSEDDKCDIIMKYFDEEARELQELGEIPEHVKIAEGGIGLDDDEGFGDSDDEDEDGEEKKEVDIDNI